MNQASVANLVEANDRRHRQFTTATLDAARAVTQHRDHRLGARAVAAAELLVERPDAPIADLAATFGATKNAYGSLLRRAVRTGQRIQARGGGAA